MDCCTDHAEAGLTNGIHTSPQMSLSRITTNGKSTAEGLAMEDSPKEAWPRASPRRLDSGKADFGKDETMEQPLVPPGTEDSSGPQRPLSDAALVCLDLPEESTAFP